MRINGISESLPPVVRLLRHLVLACLHCNAFVYAVHVPGCTNSLANALSRFQWDKFRFLALGAVQLGVPQLWQIVLE